MQMQTDTNEEFTKKEQKLPKILTAFQRNLKQKV